ADSYCHMASAHAQTAGKSDKLQFVVMPLPFDKLLRQTEVCRTRCSLEDRGVILLPVDRVNALGPIAELAHFQLGPAGHLRIIKDPKDSSAAAGHQSVSRAQAKKPLFDFRDFWVSGEHWRFQIVSRHER